ncbi:MAG TPA: hypothetical protein VGC42_04720 [Kofleriaceae bacterium]
MDIRFADHSSFQRAAAGMVGGAVVLGSALHPVTAVAPMIGGGLGIGLGLMIARRPGWPRGVRGLAGLVFAAVAIGAAMWCAMRIGVARQTAMWPALARTAVAAAAVGVVGALALLPRHLRLVSDPVRAALARLPAALDAEVRGLCDRAVRIWASADGELGDDASKALIRDGVVTTLDVAAKSAEVRIAGPTAAELTGRIADLDQRIAAATDREVSAQYQAARGALADQQRYRDHIAQRRERLVARMHNHVAALERFELAATDLTAARAARDGSPEVSQLEALSHDVTASGDALAELELGDAAAAQMPAPGAAGA